MSCPSVAEAKPQRIMPTPLPQVGEMNDAGEVLLTLYERIREADPDGATMVDGTFGLSVFE